MTAVNIRDTFHDQWFLLTFASFITPQTGRLVAPYGCQRIIGGNASLTLRILFHEAPGTWDGDRHCKR